MTIDRSEDARKGNAEGRASGGSAPSDEELVARLRSGDGQAFSDLVRAHQGPVYRLLLRMLGDPAEAEDVAQDVFVSVFKAIANFRGDSRLSTWIFRITTNHAKNRIKYLARRERDAKHPFDDNHNRAADALVPTGASVPAPDQMAEGRQAESLLLQALDSLDEGQRTLIVLRDVEHVSYEEIRAITGVPSGTVKSRLHRARMALHERFVALQEES